MTVDYSPTTACPSSTRWPTSPLNGAEQQTEAQRLDAAIEENLKGLGFG